MKTERLALALVVVSGALLAANDCAPDRPVLCLYAASTPLADVAYGDLDATCTNGLTAVAASDAVVVLHAVHPDLDLDDEDVTITLATPCASTTTTHRATDGIVHAYMLVPPGGACALRVTATLDGTSSTREVVGTAEACADVATTCAGTQTP